MSRRLLRRWPVLLLLGVLPFTLAPKTSWGPGALQAEVVQAPATVTAGQVFPVRVVVSETLGGSTVGDDLTLTTGGTGLRFTEVEAVALPDGCVPAAAQDLIASCTLPRLNPYQQRVLVFVLRATIDGPIAFTLGGDISNL